MVFQSTRPVRGGTKAKVNDAEAYAISIHPPRAGRDSAPNASTAYVSISIHPPHAGRDDDGLYLIHVTIISIHPPHAGRDAAQACDTRNTVQFQSTRPMRGGTLNCWNCCIICIFQSTRPMRGGTLEQYLPMLANIFQSTRPMRGGTQRRLQKT